MVISGMKVEWENVRDFIARSPIFVLVFLPMRLCWNFIYISQNSYLKIKISFDVCMKGRIAVVRPQVNRISLVLIRYSK